MRTAEEIRSYVEQKIERMVNPDAFVEMKDILNFIDQKDNEDEQTRNFLIEIIDKYAGVSNKEKERCIAYLKKDTKIVIPKFRVGDTIRIKNSYAEHKITDISDGCYRGKGWYLEIATVDEGSVYELVEHNSSDPERFNLNKKEGWNNEDIGTLEDAITAVDMLLTDEFKENHPNLFSAFLVAKTWLKQLPERLDIQQSREWSKGEKVAIECAVDVLNESGLPSLAASIKCLHPHINWKPSDKEFDALEYIINSHYLDAYYLGIIEHLYEQLQNLK